MDAVIMDSREVKGVPFVAAVGRQTLFHNGNWETLVAGSSGGAVATFVLHPLDLVRIRLQVNESTGLAFRPQYNGTVDALRSIYRSNGIAGLYQGAVPNVLGTGISWGLFFFFFNNIKTWMQGGDAKQALGPGKEFLASYQAGLLTLVLMNPLSVAKSRIYLEYKQSAGATFNGVCYKGTASALSNIYRIYGVRGLYKGFIPGLVGNFHGAIQFMIYEELKNYNKKHYSNGNVDTRLYKCIECLAIPAISKIIAVLMMYPCQVIRTRLHDQHRSYSGITDVIKQMIKTEGTRSLYKGVCAQLCQSVPNICIVFMVYQCITSRAVTNDL
ncbi:hypothetical protein CHS0354_026870 [Potamilus streckersoni]|uniref:Mitochondrial folate transporter/carrier n=1 Tax=Potamilus streckersoni TaxID=2493646 RepID=A0AAE0SPB7_9BIVA|nr:hypothetical protein CHS0354_026870 [Potamilus streckersoni]